MIVDPYLTGAVVAVQRLARAGAEDGIVVPRAFCCGHSSGVSRLMLEARRDGMQPAAPPLVPVSREGALPAVGGPNNRCDSRCRPEATQSPDPEAPRKLNAAFHPLQTPDRRRHIQEHLDGCFDCYGAFDFEAELRIVVSRRCRDEVPEGLRNRVADALRQLDESSPG